jgi:hypothetical protein
MNIHGRERRLGLTDAAMGVSSVGRPNMDAAGHRRLTDERSTHDDVYVDKKGT